MKVKLSELKDVSLKAIKSYGYNEKEAEVIQNLLMYAQLRGNNQGVVKLIGKGIPKSNDAKEPSIEKESDATALINANQTMEAIALEQAVEMVTQKAKKSGIAIVGVHNGAGSSGAIGYWSRRIADKGLIGITMSSYPLGSIPPHGSYEPLFCTNPIAWGVPTDKEPIVLDMASSAIAWFGLVEAKTEGRKLDNKAGYDKDGKETDDPEKIMEGAIKPFDNGFKGAGLALMVQIIGGALVGADFNNGTATNDGNVVIAINPESLAGMDRFIQEVEKMKVAMKKAKKLEGVEEILIPGERGDRIKQRFEESGEVEIEENLWNELKKVAGN